MKHTRRRGTRAQTTLDFAIAMGVFLLAVAFVFTFIPSLTAPFVDGSQEHTAAADRMSSNLAEGSLADPNEPYVLDVACTTGLFNETDDDTVDHCGYTTESADYRDRIGASDRLNVNVTVVHVDADTRDKIPLCDDGSGDVVAETHGDCDADDVVYRIGDDRTHARSVTVARRIVSIDGRDATLFVRVW